jgi:ATP-dependent DNA ligase
MQPTNFAQPFLILNGSLNQKGNSFRAVCYFSETIRFISRRKNDLTKRSPELQGVQDEAQSAIIDGEITTIDDKRLPRFDELKKSRRPWAIVYYAFDLLILNGEDLRDLIALGAVRSSEAYLA